VELEVGKIGIFLSWRSYGVWFWSSSEQ